MWKRAVVVVIALAAASGMAACSGSPSSTGSSGSKPDGTDAGGTVLVFAAASLTDAFAEIETTFESAHPGVDVQLSVAGSSALREQILGGAPADVFASANESTMQAVVDAGEVDGRPEVFAHNELQIAVPEGNPAGVRSLDDFARPELLLGLCAEGVPCGDFALEALASAGFEPSVDTYEPDVRALLAKIEAGELDAGVVYRTDVIASAGAVEGVDIPAEHNVIAGYPIAPLVGAPNPEGAAAFIAFVLSPEGQSLLASYGFTTA